jgi:hypothetical protein
MFLQILQVAGKPNQAIGLGPNGHMAASVCFCSRRILRILFILSKQSDRLFWTLDAERTCILLDGPALNSTFSWIVCHTGLWVH